MTATDNLTAAIDELILGKTFSLDGVEAIKKLRDRAAVLDAQLATAQAQNSDLSKQLSNSREQVATLTANASAVTLREATVMVRESKITELEKSAAVSAAKSDVYSTVFNTIFRNTVVRESMTKQVAVPYSGGGASMQQVNESMSRDTE